MSANRQRFLTAQNGTSKRKKKVYPLHHFVRRPQHTAYCDIITFIKHLSVDPSIQEKKTDFLNSVFSQFSPNYKLVLKLAHSSPISLAFSLRNHTLYKMSLHLFYRATYFYIGSHGGQSIPILFIAFEAIIYFKNNTLPLTTVLDNDRTVSINVYKRKQYKLHRHIFKYHTFF